MSYEITGLGALADVYRCLQDTVAGLGGRSRSILPRRSFGSPMAAT
jgi:hypothetical protein